MVLERHPLAFGYHCNRRRAFGDIKVTLPGGRLVEASLAGRDPTTDVAVLRFQPDGQPIASIADGSLRPGQIALAVGNYEGGPLAALGIIAVAGGAWHSVRGGTIDSLIRLDLALSPAAEGGALIDAQGRVIGMRFSDRDAARLPSPARPSTAPSISCWRGAMCFVAISAPVSDP